MEKSGFINRMFEENKFVWGSFVLAALVMFAAYIFLGYYPMGDNIILKVDMYHQYGPFHEELRDRLVNGRSFLYSWEGGLGKDFISQFAYYTASPLSFLMVFFPQENMPEAMALFVLLKVAFCASFFAFYLKKRFGRNDITIVIFSLMYSSMAFITSYYWNVMWLDAIALFPLVALGIESLIKEKKYKMYCISLALTILVNFYIAFLVCVFAALYFAVVVFSTYSWKTDKKIILNRFLHFAILSIIAGGISMVLTIPTAVALSHTQASDSNFPTLKVYDNVYQLLTNHFIGARPVVLARNEDLPNLYSGLLTILLMPVYYLNKNIKRKEKILYSLFLGFMLLCSCVNTLDFLIHGMHFPSNLPHRFTFIYSFTIITMAYKAFLNIRAVNFKKIYIFLGIFVAVIALTEYVIAPLNKEVEKVLTNYDVAINVAVGAVYVVFLYQIFKGVKKDVPPLVGLAVLIFAECIFSTTTGIAYTGRTEREKYVKYIPGIERTIDYLKEKDGNDFNRMEMRRFVTINESSLYHFKGYSQFSSLAYGNTSQLMQDLGMAATGNSYRLYDPTPLLDSMFNLKYIINRDRPLTNPFYNQLVNIPAGTDEEVETLNKIKEYIGTDDTSVIAGLSKEQQDYIKDLAGVNNLGDIYGINNENEDYIYVYENPYVLPLGFMVKSDVKDWATDVKNPFDAQNDFIFKTTNTEENILENIDLTSIDFQYLKITNQDEETNEYNVRNVNKYSITKPQDLTAKPKMTATIKNDKTQRVFLYVDAGNAKRAVYTVKDKDGNQLDRQDRELSTGRSLLDIGTVDEGSSITLELELTRKGEYEKTYRKTGSVYIYAASFNEEVFKKAQSELAKTPMEISEYGDDFVNGTVNVQEDGFLYTSIPYDKGWSIKVDGKPVEGVAFANEGLLGVDLTKGTHTLQFSYYPQGFNLGIAVSVVSIIAFIAYIVINEKKNKQQNAENTQPEETSL